jgi:phage shock protein A
LIVFASSASVHAQSLESMRNDYRQAVETRRATIEKMETIETRYNELAARLDRLKSKGTDEISNRLEVKTLMRQSQTLTDRLETFDHRIDRLDEKLERLRGQLVSRLDEVVAETEAKLVDASARKRRALVGRLNELRKLQSTYESPLPDAPDPSDVTETLKMARELQGHRPDRMVAAAAELKDTEDQVRKRLKAIEDKLRELEQAKTLARRAETFQSEESFFDEASRPHVVARHESGDSASNRDSSSGDDTPNDSGGGAADSSDDRTASPGGTGGGTTGSGGPTLDKGGEQSSGSGNRAQRPPAVGQDGAQERPAADDPNVGGPSATERFAPAREASPEASGGSNVDNSTGGGGESSGTSMIFESEADLSTAVESEDDDDDSTLEARIEKLEAEREHLEQQAERLEKKADDLESRAEALDTFEK